MIPPAGNVLPHRYVLTAGTLYTAADARFESTLKMLETAHQYNVPVLISEGSPSQFADTARREFTDRGAIILNRTVHTMAGSRIEMWNYALQYLAPIVITTEPEKESLPLYAEAIAERIEAGCNIVIPGVSRENMFTYPDLQRLAEGAANALTGTFTGLNLDWWRGPKAFDATAAPYFTGYDGTASDGGDPYPNLWEGLMVPVIRAYADGLMVSGIEIDCPYPLRMRAAEEADSANAGPIALKRYDQLQVLLEVIKRESKHYKLGIFGDQ